MTLLVGLDVGTSGLKAIAVRSDSGAVIASATREYPLYTDQPQWAEQDGADFSRAAIEVLTEIATRVGAEKSDIAGIGLTGQMHSAILLDASGDLVRRAILWCDTRTTEECAQITRVMGSDGLLRSVKNLALEGFTLPKLLWLRRHEPEVFARVRRVVMPKDYVGFKLTGETSTDVSDASGTLAFDPASRTWSQEILRALEIDPALFAPAHESATVLGPITARVAAATGLPVGTVVVRGAADNAAGAVGLGVVRSGRAMASIGTSGVVLAHTDELRVDAKMRLHAFCSAVPQRSYVMGVMLSAGGALRWYRDTIAHRPYDQITAGAARARHGARGLIFLPYLMGERTPHNDSAARGAFVGLSAATDSDDLDRAVLEGISFGLADSLDLMRALDPPMQIDELRLTGGGARSAVWRQLLADIFGTQVATTNSTEGPAYGAALIAGAATGAFANVEEAADALVKVTERIDPRPDEQGFYREMQAIYRGLYSDLRGRFVELQKSGAL